MYVFSVDSFYPPQSPLGKGGSSVLPLGKGELEGVSQRTLNTYAPCATPTDKFIPKVSNPRQAETRIKRRESFGGGEVT
jgi:hypothetical protein